MNFTKKELVLVKLEGKVVGPVSVKRLYDLKGFNAQSLVSIPGSEKWATAWRVLDMKTYEPPVAQTAPVIPNWREWLDSVETPLQKNRYIGFSTGSAVTNRETWVDRWFRRLAIVNAALALTAALAWFNPHVQAALRHELPLITKHTLIAKHIPTARLQATHKHRTV